MTKSLLEKQAEEITTILPRLMRQLFRLYPDDPALEMPGAQIRVCSLLHDGSQSMSALSRELGISLSAITQIADRLERARMVERVADPDDRRVKLLQLTEYGMETMRSRRERRISHMKEVLDHVDSKSRPEILNILTTLLEAAHKTSPSAPTDANELESLIS